MYKEFWQLFAREHGGLRIGLSYIFVSMVVALMEGLNVGLLIPLLETLKSGEEVGGHWISRSVQSFFEFLGIPFQLESIVLTMGVLVLVTATLKYLRFVLLGRASLGFVVWLRSRYMRSLLHADITHFHHENIGKLTDTVTAQTERGAASLYYATQIVGSLGLVTAYMIAAFMVSPVLTGVAFGLLVTLTLSVQFHVIRARKISAHRVLKHNDLQASALENLSGIRVIKSFLLEKLRFDYFTRRAQDLQQAEYDMHINQSQMTVLQEMSVFGLVAGLVLVGVSVLSFDIAIIVALLFILYRMTPQVASINIQRQSMTAAMESIRSVNTANQVAAERTVANGSKTFTGFESEIRLQDVGFAYDGNTQVLQKIGLTLKKGTTTAIVGASGAGKSTIVDLLFRLYDPSDGQIMADGTDIKEFDTGMWRSSIGVVSQDTFLFNESIADNISLWRPNVSQEDIEIAAQKAYAHDFIVRLPDGYDTKVGDRGWNLSGGERQRVALARAILGDPELLVLDEATSSLDSESERLIQKYLQEIRGSSTVVLVSHRMATVQGADLIVVMQDGQIIEDGSWDSLLEGAGVFASFHRLQSGG